MTVCLINAFSEQFNRFKTFASLFFKCFLVAESDRLRIALAAGPFF